MNKIDEACQRALKNLREGKLDIYDYLPILFQLRKEENYEEMQGIKTH